MKRQNCKISAHNTDTMNQECENNKDWEQEESIERVRNAITLLGDTGTRFSMRAEPSVTGRPHAAVKENSRVHHSPKTLPTTLNY